MSEPTKPAKRSPLVDREEIPYLIAVFFLVVVGVFLMFGPPR